MAKSKRRARARKKATKQRRTSLLPWLIVSVSIILVTYFVWSQTYTRQTNLDGTWTASVGIIDQFHSRRPGFTNHLVELLEEHDITYRVYKDAEVTVDFYRDLPTFEHKLLILRVHAGISVGEEPKTALFTSEEYSLDKYFVEQLRDQVGEGIFWAQETSVFTISPEFVTDCMKGDFKDTAIILSSCWGLHNTHLAEAFVERGALSFIGWDERVELGHTDEATLVLLNFLIAERLTIEEAVDRVMEEVGADPVYGCVLKYYSHGNVRVPV